MPETPLLQNISLFLDDKPSVYALREKARQLLLQCGYPTVKTEAWKYTDIRPILNSRLKVDASEHICGHDCCQHNDKAPSIEIKFCGGKLHIEEYNLPDGISITPLPLALYEDCCKPYLFHSFNLENHPFAALNGVYLEQGIYIHIEKDVRITQPIVINYSQNGCIDTQCHIHNIIVAEKNAQAEIFEKFSSDKNNCYLLNIVNEIYLKPDSKLNHYKKQKESLSGYHIALNAAKIQQGATYKQYYLAEGGKICRQENIINLEQAQASAEIYSAYTAKKNCLNDITSDINHLHSETFSNQYAKAVLESDSSAVFQGKIHIAPLAVKTAGHQLHKALYLDGKAQLDCKPELEIFADDVKCSHGASCGEINKDQLFYLMSRGIDQASAIRILTEAHLNEIIELIPNEKIRTEFCA